MEAKSNKKQVEWEELQGPSQDFIAPSLSENEREKYAEIIDTTRALFDKEREEMELDPLVEARLKTAFHNKHRKSKSTIFSFTGKREDLFKPLFLGSCAVAALVLCVFYVFPPSSTNPNGFIKRLHSRVLPQQKSIPEVKILDSTEGKNMITENEDIEVSKTNSSDHIREQKIVREILAMEDFDRELMSPNDLYQYTEIDELAGLNADETSLFVDHSSIPLEEFMMYTILPTQEEFYPEGNK